VIARGRFFVVWGFVSGAALHRHCEGGTTVVVPAITLRRHSGNDGVNCAAGLSGTPAMGAPKATRKALFCLIPVAGIPDSSFFPHFRRAQNFRNDALSGGFVTLHRHSGNDGVNCAAGLSGTPAPGAPKATRHALFCLIPMANTSTGSVCSLSVAVTPSPSTVTAREVRPWQSPLRVHRRRHGKRCFALFPLRGFLIACSIPHTQPKQSSE